MHSNLSRTESFERRIPLVLRPVLRAYLLGYLSSTAPRLLTLLLTQLSRRRKNVNDQSDEDLLQSSLRILKGGLELQRFPTFCAALVGGKTLLQARDPFVLLESLPNYQQFPLRRILERLLSSSSHVIRLRWVVYCCDGAINSHPPLNRNLLN